MFKILGIGRIHSIHWPHATDVCVSLFPSIKQRTCSLIVFMPLWFSSWLKYYVTLKLCNYVCGTNCFFTYNYFYWKFKEQRKWYSKDIFNLLFLQLRQDEEQINHWKNSLLGGSLIPGFKNIAFYRCFAHFFFK